MTIQIDDLRGPEIAALLRQHLHEMAATSPPESRHALDLEGLRKPGITFWSVWEGEELVGGGALKEMDGRHAEIKSMRTARVHKGNGIGARMLRHLLAEAGRRGYERLSLETGSMAFFASAHGLYTKFGFEDCAPFADYCEDRNSRFLSRLV